MGSCLWHVGEERCPHGSGVGICARLCIYAFRIVRIVVYDVGGCHMSVVIDPG